jgi:hypothetical protein
MEPKPIYEIREEYPHPKRQADDTCMPDDYCVGGAICLAHGFENTTDGLTINFPDEAELAAVLELLNPGIDTITAWNLAVRIIEKNDQGSFEDAWDTAETALILNNGF